MWYPHKLHHFSLDKTSQKTEVLILICAELGCFAASSCNIGKHGFLSNDELRLVRGSENGHGCDKFKLILVNLQVQTPR